MSGPCPASLTTALTALGSELDALAVNSARLQDLIGALAALAASPLEPDMLEGLQGADVLTQRLTAAAGLVHALAEDPGDIDQALAAIPLSDLARALGRDNEARPRQVAASGDCELL